MAKIHFRPYSPNQIVLIPQRMDENIPSDDPVRILNAMVDNLDLSFFHKLYKELGRSPYHPRMMLKAVLYTYLNNIYSCRKIEKSITRDIHFIWLAGNERPDHQTINRFRNRVKYEKNKIFTQVVLVLAAKGSISLDVEYVDGTKIESKANRYTFVWRKNVERNRDKLQEYDRQMAVLGDRNSYSKTDPDATFMRMKEDHMKNGQTKPGYNLQIGTENQFLVDFALYPNPTDTLTMIPFETSFMERYGHFPSEEIADSGYGSEENYRFMEENGIEAFVKYNFFHKEQRPRYVADPFRQESFYYNREEDYYVCPSTHETYCCKTFKDRKRICF